MSDEIKYWIEAGRFVERIVGPSVVMTVQELIKQEVIYNDRTGHEKKRVFTKGVKCHWISETGLYQEAIFRTDELRPHTIVTIAQDVQDTIPE